MCSELGATDQINAEMSRMLLKNHLHFSLNAKINHTGLERFLKRFYGTVPEQSKILL